MGILRDIDQEFMAQRPLPAGAAWLVGGGCWHALMADLTRAYRDQGRSFDPSEPPEELFGVPLRRIHRMGGWGLAVALDVDVEAAQEPNPLELTPHVQ